MLGGMDQPKSLIQMNWLFSLFLDPILVGRLCIGISYQTVVATCYFAFRRFGTWIYPGREEFMHFRAFQQQYRDYRPELSSSISRSSAIRTMKNAVDWGFPGLVVDDRIIAKY